MVFWPCLGNHDVRTSTGGPWRDAFWTPANNASQSENYYSFDYGNAHVVVLNSNASTSPGSAQYKFLDEDLAASTARWKFVAFHHTIYSSGRHTSDKLRQKNLAPLFDKHAVDVVFMGHDHDYERTKPLVNTRSLQRARHGLPSPPAVADAICIRAAPRAGPLTRVRAPLHARAIDGNT
jgi:hypothetical protein